MREEKDEDEKGRQTRRRTEPEKEKVRNYKKAIHDNALILQKKWDSIDFFFLFFFLRREKGNQRDYNLCSAHKPL